MKRKVFIQAENHQIELEDAERAIDELTTLLVTATSDRLRKRATEQLRALDSRVTELQLLPQREARWEWVEDGETYAEVWAASDTGARRQLLLKSGITLSVSYTDKILRGELRVP